MLYDIFNAPLDELAYPLWRLELSVQDLSVEDHIPESTWHKFLCYNTKMTRFKGSSMLSVLLEQCQSSTEILSRLKVRVLPLRFHVDQDALEFMMKFLSGVSSQMEVPQSSKPNQDWIFEKVELSPLRMEIDYKAKNISLQEVRDGNWMHLINLASIQEMAINLSALRLDNIRGGWSELSETIIGPWTSEFLRKAPIGWLTGLGLFHSIRLVGKGMADLVYTPYEGYTRSGSSGLVQGLTEGTRSFAKNIFDGATDLGLRVIRSTQTVLERAGTTFSPTEISSPASRRRSGSHGRPGNATEGLEHAFQSVSKNFAEAANTIIIPLDVYRKRGVSGYITQVLRAVPVAMLIKPMIGATEGVTKVVQGVRTSLDPTEKNDNESKYKK
eukprot:TRINITY_DN4612_c0_g1_i1.p1 TRINITY_DN4612_c0_g1~~TRINITY_DN4612_c0_g1_i1.p1  ORF type:complete len:397 (+),score=44.44 TRINITY_DN4612_c0_g1_i1:37-1191(+)